MHVRLVTLAILTACGGATPARITAPAVDAPERIRVTDGVYQLHLGMYYDVVVLTSAGAVVIDPMSDRAAGLLVDMIHDLAPGKPLLAIVYSHWHLDHASGAPVLRRAFGAEVPIVGHERLGPRLDADSVSTADVPRPTRTVGDGPTVLTFGDKTIELRYLGHAHTNNMLVMRILPDDVLYACDFVQNRGVGYQELPGVEIDEQVAMLHRLLALDFGRATFCHTPPGDRTAVQEYLRYFEGLWDESAAALGDGLDADAAAARATARLARYRQWRRASMWFEGNVRGVVRWLREHPGATRPTGPTPIPPPTLEERERLRAAPPAQVP